MIWPPCGSTLVCTRPLTFSWIRVQHRDQLSPRSCLYCSSTPFFDFSITQNCTMESTGCPSSTILPSLTTSLFISILKLTPISYWRKFFSLNAGVDFASHSLNRLLLEYCMGKVQRAEHRPWHATPGEGVQNRQEHTLAIL